MEVFLLSAVYGLFCHHAHDVTGSPLMGCSALPVVDTQVVNYQTREGSEPRETALLHVSLIHNSVTCRFPITATTTQKVRVEPGTAI